MSLKNSKLYSLYIHPELVKKIDLYKQRHYFNSRNQAILAMIRKTLEEDDAKRDRRVMDKYVSKR